MKSMKDQVINQSRDRTWIRYEPDQHRQHRGKNHDRVNAHYQSLVRALDHVNLTNRSDPNKQYNRSRKQRHQNVYNQHQSDLDGIFQSLHSSIQLEIEQLKIELDRNQLDIQSTLVNLTDEILFEMRLDAFESVWNHVSDLYLQRDQIRSHTDLNISHHITDHIHQMKILITSTMQQLIQIAFQLQPEIEYMLYLDLVPINEKFIDMNVTLSEFRSRLHLADIRLKQRHTILYHERRHVWRLLQHDRAIKIYETKFRSDQYSNPDWRQRIISELASCDSRLAASIEYLMSGLHQLIPPILSSSKVMQIQAEVSYVIQTSTQISNQCLQSFTDCLQSMENDMKQQIGDLTNELIQYGAYDQEHLTQQVQTQISVIVDEYHQRYINELDQISLSLQQQEKLLNERLGAALKFYQNAGHIWENSLKSIDDLEVDTSESWMRRHDLYDDETQSYEDELKTIMEGLRQAPTETVLTTTFEQANAILGPAGRIEKCHRSFLQDSLDIARGHLPNLDKVLESVRSNICTLLKLNGNDIQKDLCLNEGTDVQIWASQILSEAGPTPSATDPNTIEPTADVNPVVQQPESVPSPESIPQLVTKPIIPVEQYQFNMPLFCSMIAELRNAFVSQTNEIAHRERDRVQLLIEERVQEVSVLIDKNLRILAPRIIQLDADIVQIRANELKENYKRFHRFWDRYDQTFSNGQAAIKSACTLLEKDISDRDVEIQRIKDIAVKAQTMQKLQLLHNKSSSLSKKFKNHIRVKLKSAQSLYEDLGAQLTQLREQFLASCFVFGSNSSSGTASYHPDEFKKYEAEVEILRTESQKQLTEQATVLEQIQKKIESMISDKVTDEVIRQAKSDLNTDKSARSSAQNATNTQSPSK